MIFPGRHRLSRTRPANTPFPQDSSRPIAHSGQYRREHCRMAPRQLSSDEGTRQRHKAPRAQPLRKTLPFARKMAANPIPTHLANSLNKTGSRQQPRASPKRAMARPRKGQPTAQQAQAPKRAIAARKRISHRQAPRQPWQGHGIPRSFPDMRSGGRRGCQPRAFGPAQTV